MNEKRRKAFDDWWLLHATPEGRTTPSAIWEAACDWMLEEVRWKVEKMMERDPHD
jgi:hypothetical protein